MLGALALTTTGLFLNYALLVKTHGVFALHMLVACAALYFAAREGRTAWLVLALAFVAPFPLLRLESGVTAFPILVVAVAVSGIPIRTRLIGVGAVALAWSLIYTYLLAASVYFDGFVRGLVYKKFILIGAPSCLFGVGLLGAAILCRTVGRERVFDRLAALLPNVMVATLSAIVAAHAVAAPQRFSTAMRGLIAIFEDPGMGFAPFAVAVAALLILSLAWRPRVPGTWAIMVPVLSYLLILILADFHLDGMPHWGRFAALTRILSHVLPTMLFCALLPYFQRDPVGSHAPSLFGQR